MTTLLTEPAAAAILTVHEADLATLSDVAQASGRSTSTAQRAVDGLVKAGVLVRDAPRGSLRFAAEAPRGALRDLAQWRLGPEGTRKIVLWIRRNDAARGVHRPPSTIRDPLIREAWPGAMERIVSAFNPRRIVLFGSQARGDARHGSDVDLLVVFDDAIDHRAMRVAVTRLLADMPFAKDVLVATTADIEHPLRGSALAEAARDGITAYER